MFAIFGVSMALAKKELEKKLKNMNSRFTIAYRKASQDEQVEMYNEEANRLFNTIQPKMVSAELSDPTSAKQVLEQFKKDSSFKDLMIKARVPARNKDGKVKTSKGGKTSLTWVPFHEYEKHMQLLEQDQKRAA